MHHRSIIQGKHQAGLSAKYGWSVNRGRINPGNLLLNQVAEGDINTILIQVKVILAVKGDIFNYRILKRYFFSCGTLWEKGNIQPARKTCWKQIKLWHSQPACVAIACSWQMWFQLPILYVYPHGCGYRLDVKKASAFSSKLGLPGGSSIYMYGLFCGWKDSSYVSNMWLRKGGI